MSEPRYLQLRDFTTALNADIVKKSRARGTSPPWLKDHAGQLEDPEYVNLTFGERGLLKDLRLLALRRGNKIFNDEAYLRLQLRCTSRTRLVPKLYRLRALGFLEEYNAASNDAANELDPSRTSLDEGERDSPLEGEEKENTPPTPPKGGRRRRTKNGVVETPIAVAWINFVNGLTWDDVTSEDSIREELDRLRHKATNVGEIDTEDALKAWRAKRSERYPNSQSAEAGAKVPAT